jgi:hypothetical protein
MVVPPFEDRSHPALLLASYYNALERREYERAYAYRADQSQLTLEQLIADADGIEELAVLIIPPILIQATPQGAQVSIPAYVSAVTADGNQRNLLGCYVLQQQELAWVIAGGQLAAVEEQVTPAALTNACPPLQTPADSVTPPFDNTADPVGLLSSYVNALERREYERALGYSRGDATPEVVAGLEQIYSGTLAIELIVIPPDSILAAGQVQLAEIPALMQITEAEGRVIRLQGCIGAARDGVLPGTPWRLSSLAFQPVAEETFDLRNLATVCGP